MEEETNDNLLQQDAQSHRHVSKCYDTDDPNCHFYQAPPISTTSDAYFSNPAPQSTGSIFGSVPMPIDETGYARVYFPPQDHFGSENAGLHGDPNQKREFSLTGHVQTSPYASPAESCNYRSAGRPISVHNVGKSTGEDAISTTTPNARDLYSQSADHAEGSGRRKSISPDQKNRPTMKSPNAADTIGTSGKKRRGDDDNEYGVESSGDDDGDQESGQQTGFGATVTYPWMKRVHSSSGMKSKPDN